MAVEVQPRPQEGRSQRSSLMTQEDISIAFAGFDLGIDPIGQNTNVPDQESLTALFESVDLLAMTSAEIDPKSPDENQTTHNGHGQGEYQRDNQMILGQEQIAQAFGDFELFDVEGAENENMHQVVNTTATDSTETNVLSKATENDIPTLAPQTNSKSTLTEPSTQEIPNQEPLVEQTQDDLFGRAWELFKSRFGQIQEAQQMYDSMHMQVCTGLDGHITASRTTALKPVDDSVMETSFLNILNTLDGNMLRSFVESAGESSEVLQVVDEVAAATIDRMNGTNLSETIRSLYENGGSMLPPQDMASQMMQQHIHGANCDHGGEGMASMGFAGLSMPGFSSDGTIFKSTDHSHHNYFCKKCNKVVHLHGPTCSCGGKKSDLVHLDSPQGRVIQRQIAASKVH